MYLTSEPAPTCSSLSSSHTVKDRPGSRAGSSRIKRASESGRFGTNRHIFDRNNICSHTFTVHSRCTPDHCNKIPRFIPINPGGDTIRPGLAPEEPRLSKVEARCVPDSADAFPIHPGVATDYHGIATTYAGSATMNAGSTTVCPDSPR